MIGGGATSDGIFILGVFFVLFALENWRRLKEEREKAPPPIGRGAERE
jgi:hypothetical protein